jgi:hypothetical protein
MRGPSKRSFRSAVRGNRLRTVSSGVPRPVARVFPSECDPGAELAGQHGKGRIPPYRPPARAQLEAYARACRNGETEVERGARVRRAFRPGVEPAGDADVRYEATGNRNGLSNLHT